MQEEAPGLRNARCKRSADVCFEQIDQLCRMAAQREQRRLDGKTRGQVPLFARTGPDRVAQGSCLPWAPTDPYGHALVHTVPQKMGSLRGAVILV